MQIRIVQRYLDPLFWTFEKARTEKHKFYEHFSGDILKYYNQNYVPFDLEKIDNNDRPFGFVKYCFTEYIYSVKEKVIIEPKYQWFIYPDTKEVSIKSLMFSEDPWSGKPANHFPSPSILNYIFGKKIVLDEVLSVRFLWGNYYHFFFDTLPQIVLFDKKHGGLAQIPILVPSDAFDHKFVKEFNQISDLLKNYKFIFFEKNTIYEIKSRAHFAKAKSVDVAIVGRILESIDQKLFMDNLSLFPKKIFLTRDSNKVRSMVNNIEITAIAQKFGYVLVDTDKMPLCEQVTLFYNVEEVVALHGAGLTNLIFRKGKPLKVLEIFNSDTTPEFYQRVCTMLGYNHSSIVGGKPDWSNGQRFLLDEKQFEQALLEFEKKDKTGNELKSSI